MDFLKKISAKQLVIYIVVAFVFNRVLLWLEGIYDIPIFGIGYLVDVSLLVAIVYLPIRMIIEIRQASKTSKYEK